MYKTVENIVPYKVKTPENAHKRKNQENIINTDTVIDALLRMAKSYGINDNELFKRAIETYAFQLELINKIKEQINQESLLTTKEYVKNRENIYINPLVKELPKHLDSANKTISTILNIISQLGVNSPSKSVLDRTLEKLTSEIDN